MANSYDDDIVLNVNLDTDQVVDRAERLTDHLGKIFSGASKSDKLDGSFQRMQMRMNDLTKKSQDLRQRIEELGNTKIPTEEYTQITTSLEKLETEYDKLRAKREELVQQQQKLGAEKVPTKEYEEVGKAMDAAQKKLASLQDAQAKFVALGGSKNSSRYKSLQYDIDKTKLRIESLRAEQKQLIIDGEAYTNSDAYKKVSQDLQGVNSELVKVIGSQDRLLQQKGDLEASGQAYTLGVDTQEYDELGSKLNDVNNRMAMLKGELSKFSSVGTSAFSVVKSAVSRLASGFVAANKQALKLAYNVSKVAGSTIISGIKKLGNAIANLGKHTSSTNGGLEKGFKSFIRYGLGVRSVFALINKLRRALIEGFGNLAQVHEPFNQAMSNIMSSLNLLKNSFASAFAPIIETVEPILTRLIVKLSEAVSTVGQFIAAITGKQFVKAGMVQTDYAKSVDKSAKSSASAAKATNNQRKEAEKLKKTLAGFDDVEILKGPDEDTSSSGDTPTAAATPDYSFSTAPIEGEISDFAKKILDAWKNADFYDIGRIVGEKLKAALEAIPWDQIKSVLAKVARSIASFLNGFLETPGLFLTIGKTIAEGLNSALTFVEEFVRNFHWKSLGKAISDLLIGVFDNIDWPLLRTTLAELGAGLGEALNEILTNEEMITKVLTGVGTLIEAMINGFHMFLVSVNWGEIGTTIGTGLNNAIEDFNWGTISGTLISLLNNAFSLWYNFVTTFDFKKFGEKIGTTFSDTIKGIDWATGGASVAQTINGLFDALNGFIEKTDWKELGKSVIELISGFFNELDIGKISSFITNIWIAVFDFLSGALEEINWKELPGNIMSKIKETFEGFDFAGLATSIGTLLGTAIKGLVEAGSPLLSDMAQFGKDVWQGGLDGILEGLSNIGTWIVDNIWTPFKEAFMNAFDMHSPSKKMLELGKDVINGLLNGIVSIMTGIGTWLKEHVTDPILGGVKSLFGFNDKESKSAAIGKRVTEGLKSGIKSPMSTMGNWIGTNITNPITNFFKSKFGIQNKNSTVFSGFGNNMMSGLQGGIKRNSSLPTTTLATTNTNMQNVIKKSLPTWKTSGQDIISSGLKPGIEARKGQVETSIQNVEKAMRTKLLANKATWKTNGTNLITQLESGITSRAKQLYGVIETVVKTMASKFANSNGTFYKAGTAMATNIESGFNAMRNNLGVTAGNMSVHMYNSFTQLSWWNVGKYIAEGIYDGLFAHQEWLETLAWNTAVAMYNSACAALEIASPSKKFAWIGEMITQGLGNGIIDNENNAVSAVTGLADAMTDEAEKANPSIAITSSVSEWINSLDTVLSTFSNMVTGSFDTLIDTLTRLSNLSSYGIPAIANGRVIPSSANVTQNTSNDVATLIEYLETLLANVITRDDLEESLTEILREYLNIDFYIGDEQIARHANTGNLKLNRRYHTILT